ncbi:MAG: molybdopterin-dependent oxidoreductase, partial [Burkholderiaceae bacterium]
MNTDTLTPMVRGACPHDCPDTCALLTEVQDGRAVKVLGNPAHPLTAGVLCTKVSRYAERVYHPERLLQPLRRVGPKGSGRFEPVSWDDALRDIAQRLAEVARQDPQAILPYSYAGTMGQVQGEAMASRFFARLGASFLDRTICSNAGKVGLTYTHGAPVGMPVETFAESRLIWIWGSNAIGSHLHFWRLAQQAKRAGAKLVCIDPRRTETADKCDQHVALRPGTDAALALGIAHQLVVNDWLDHDYLAAHTEGFEALRERALQWPAARVAQVCGIDEQVVHEMAHDYAHIQPAGIRANYGMQRARGGGNAMRAVFALPCLTGAWRHTGGGALLSNSGWFPRRATDEITPLLRASLGQRAPRVINMSTIADDLLRESSPEFGPKIQALVVYNSNPVAVAPDSARVVKGFARQDLFTVVLEQFQTDTADYADYVLPATTQLEHWDIHASYGHTDIVLNQPAIAPQGQAKPNTEVFRALATLLGFDEPCFARDDLTLCRDAFELNDDQWQQLLRDGFYRL